VLQYLHESFSTTLLTFVISVIYRYVNEAKWHDVQRSYINVF